MNRTTLQCNVLMRFAFKRELGRFNVLHNDYDVIADGDEETRQKGRQSTFEKD